MVATKTSTVSPDILPGLPEEMIKVVSEIDITTKIERTILLVHKKRFVDLRVKTRKKETLRARNQAIYLLYMYTELSLSDIAPLFLPALTDHASVLYARDTIIKALENKKIDKFNYMLGGMNVILDCMHSSEITRIKIDGNWTLKSEY